VVGHAFLVAGCLSSIALLPGAASVRISEPLVGRAPTAAELQPSVEVAFARESYRPGERARLRAFNSARGVTLRIFRIGTPRVHGPSELSGVPVTSELAIGDLQGGDVIETRLGLWDSGLYFARLRAVDGRVGFAPFVVRPAVLGRNRVAVVLPTLTWQAYNVRDDDHDGVGDTWYASWRTRKARLARPFLNRGVPYNFHRYDLPLLRWLALTGRKADILSDRDLGAARSAAALADAYDLIVFPGHHEYVTEREYDLVEGYRDRGGNLIFLSANNFFWQVVRRGDAIVRTRQWRDLRRPEAALVGVQYIANDDGRRRAPWIVRDTLASRWLFSGTGLTAGSRFGRGGIEIDATAASSPADIQVVAEIPRLFGPRFTAQMTYYETPTGARVFAAGAFRLLRSTDDAIAVRLLANLWSRLSLP
jgi:hypothetical protein